MNLASKHDIILNIFCLFCISQILALPDIIKIGKIYYFGIFLNAFVKYVFKSCDNEHSKSTLKGNLCSGFLIAYRVSIKYEF